MHTAIIGGGLSGLAAAWALEQRGLPYTVIEVKPRLGGAILTDRADGWTFDASAFVLEQYEPWPFLAPLGLADALVTIGRYRAGRLMVFRDGTAALIDALAARLTRGTFHQRMAASSLGALPDGGYGICLENGVLLPADAVIAALPARYAAHLLWSLSPDAAQLLDGYQYDSVARVALGFDRAAVPALMPNVDTWKGTLGLDAAIAYAATYDLLERVPPGGILARVGVRVPRPADPKTPFDPVPAIAVARAALRPLTGDAEPLIARAYYWPEADPLTRYAIEHTAVMAAVQAALPSRVALIGSDYGIGRNARRIEDAFAQAESAVRKVVG